MNPAEVAREVERFLARAAPVEAHAAFIYGSVAAGRAGPASDIDCFVLVAENTDTKTRERLRSGFIDLQQRLGFTPDPIHSLELFSVTRCRAALESEHVRLSLLRAAMATPETAEFDESDDMEILRALVGTRLSVVDNPGVDELALLAWALVDGVLAERPAGHRNDALRALGVRAPRRSHVR